ncbi:MAG: energy-coupling factor transporter transmembrane protein EcfT [Lachnospiraceae bacterium]|nr:energy-coupling factor transporter transmembrane protein EcfT [Lachnospiraceae bacterium]
MRYRDAFSGFHPINNFLFFIIVTGYTMFVMHPAVLIISLITANIYHISLKKEKAVYFGALYMLPLMLLAAVLNPAFNHEGVTVLTYLPSGNPLTLEACLYGAFSAVMMISVIVWFACYTEVMTSDKFVYLFGRIIPSLSLVISMALRFVPRFIEKFRQIKEARAGAGEKGNAFTELSVMITWALENSIDTADSMHARGYGSTKRTAFSIYVFGSKDKELLLWLLFCGFCLICSNAAGIYEWRFYPTFKGAPFSPVTVFSLLIFTALCLTPVFIDYSYDKH